MKNYDFKKEWPKTKKMLIKFSKEAKEMAKKGEKEILRFSKVSKLKVDETALGLKMEHYFYLIGKEYVRAKSPSKPNAKLTALLKGYADAQREQRKLRAQLKGKTTKKKAKKK